MADPTKPELKYVCPHCGQESQLGSHFCAKTKVDIPTVKTPTQLRWLWILLVLVATAVLWRFVGPLSLAVMVLGGLGWSALRRPVKKPPRS